MLQMLFRLYPIICLARNSGGADCPCPVLLCFFINHEHSVTLLNVLCSFVGGFDTEKYISQQTCADFIVSSTDYFRYNDADEYISEETIAEIQENTSETVSGSGYTTDMTTMVWMDTEQYKKMAVPYLGEEELEEKVKYYEKILFIEAVRMSY